MRWDGATTIFCTVCTVSELSYIVAVPVIKTQSFHCLDTRQGLWRYVYVHKQTDIVAAFPLSLWGWWQAENPMLMLWSNKNKKRSKPVQFVVFRSSASGRRVRHVQIQTKPFFFFFFLTF